MNILFLINSLGSPAGTERVSTILANNLADLGYNISFISLKYNGEPFFDLNNKIQIHYLSLDSSTNIYLSYISNIIKIRKILKREQIDFVIDVCTAMSLMSVPTTFFTKTKVISWEHFNANVNWNPVTSPLARKLASLFAYKIVVLTETDKKIFQTKYKARNVTIIPNPITINLSKPSSLKKKIILSIGRLEYQKGFDMLIEAWDKSRAKEDGWQLKIIGEGSLKNKLLNLIANKKLQRSIMIEEPSPNVIELYQNASIFILSSRFEGLPLVLIEAISMGLPIISFDCETGPRDIVYDNVNGRLIPPNDINALSVAIDELTSDLTLLNRYSINSLKISKNFDKSTIIQLWGKILKENPSL